MVGTRDDIIHKNPIEFLLSGQIDKWNEFVENHPNEIKVINDIDFGDKNLSNANLANITFENVNFKCANLSYSKLNNSILNNVIFFNTNITGAILKNAKFSKLYPKSLTEDISHNSPYLETNFESYFANTSNSFDIVDQSNKLKLKLCFDNNNPTYIDDPYNILNSIVSDLETLLNLFNLDNTNEYYKLTIESICGGSFIVEIGVSIIANCIYDAIKSNWPHIMRCLRRVIYQQKKKTYKNKTNTFDKKIDLSMRNIENTCKKYNVSVIKIGDDHDYKIDFII